MDQKTKILYIEDNPLSKELVRTILEKKGYDFYAADDGMHGVEVAEQEQPDLVLLDINMPGLDGYETSTRLKGLAGMENVPVIAFTAKVITKSDHKRMLAAGCDGYIPKTSVPQDLLLQIEAYLQGKRERLDENKREQEVRAYQRHLVDRLEQQITKLTRANEQLMLMNNVAQAISSTLNLKQLLKMITEQVEKTLEVEDCSLFLTESQTKDLICRAASGRNAKHVIGLRLKMGQGIAGWVAKNGESTFINDVQNDSRFYSNIDQTFSLGTRSIICVPLRVKGKVIGIIEAINKINGEFDQDSLNLLDALASTAALAIENARLYSDIRAERDQLIRKEEEVRRGIARDLHDGPTQSVSAISMNVEFIKQLRQLAPDRVDNELDKLQTMANEATRDIRNLLFGLHPVILETQGLQAALEVYEERFHSRNNTELILDIADNVTATLNKEAEVVAFIIIQEAVNNAKKHARASTIKIKLRQTDKVFAIIVQDDGEGFDVKSVTKNYDERGSFGLMTMSERASLINAKYKLQSEPGKGTSVILGFPLKSKSIETSELVESS